MRVWNIGSINIDRVYQVDHFVRPGETLASQSYHVFAGGKGFNQSIALARAGFATSHVGCVGEDGTWLLNILKRDQVDVTHCRVVARPTGHAVIQVNRQGENAIVLDAGANAEVSGADIEQMRLSMHAEDIVLLQNETPALRPLLALSACTALRVVFNPAPMRRETQDLPLEKVWMLVLNETEAEALTGQADAEVALRDLHERYPETILVLTLGGQGVRYRDATLDLYAPALPVHPVDTTAAGDTFIGYFLSAFLAGKGAEVALSYACRAAALCVTRPGASDSIPFSGELSM